MTMTNTLLPLLFTTLVSAYSFNFDNFPTQCGQTKVSITGTGGTPPYRLSIIPFGGSPLKIEVRRIMDMPFNDSSSVTFNLPYPENSTFVAVVSDKNGGGFGSGGTSVPVNVGHGSDGSCLPTQQVAPAFTFSADPLGSLTTCQSGFLNWDSGSQGTVNFWGVIPGGNSFTIPTSQQTTDQGKPAISYTPDIRPGVNVLIVGGDNRGFGSAGSFQTTLQPGNGTTSCINENSPVSTPGNPAGGSYPTNANGGVTSPSTATTVVTASVTGTNTQQSVGSTTTVVSGGNSKAKIGPIVGGAVGGVVGLCIIAGLLVFLCLRRRRSQQRKKASERPVDIMAGRHDSGGSRGGFIPQEYVPAPYQIRDSRDMMSDSTHSGVPLNRQWSGSSHTRPSTEESGHQTQNNRGSMTLNRNKENKIGVPPTAFRPVNVYQHQDSGRPAMASKPDTVEIPPAYSQVHT